jgi:hypothetical protein
MKNSHFSKHDSSTLKTLLCITLLTVFNISVSAAQEAPTQKELLQEASPQEVPNIEVLSQEVPVKDSQTQDQPVQTEELTAEKPKPAKPKPSSKIITIETKVKGSSEQPKILTLVPWQAPKAPAGLYIPMTQTLPTNVFQPVSKDSLDRLVRIYQPVIPIPVKEPTNK